MGYYYAHIETLVAYKHLKFMTIVGRFSMIEDITDDQDGKRFRLDFNYKF